MLFLHFGQRVFKPQYCTTVILAVHPTAFILWRCICVVLANQMRVRRGGEAWSVFLGRLKPLLCFSICLREVRNYFSFVHMKSEFPHPKENTQISKTKMGRRILDC